MPRCALLAALTLALPVSSALANPIEGTYYLRPGSTLHDACYDNCLCEFPAPVALRGHFLVQAGAVDPVFQNFIIHDLTWRAPSIGVTLTGGGTYQVTDLRPGSERLNLALSIQGQQPLQGEFGRRVYGGSPIINAALVLPKTECSQTVLTVRATPFRSDWNTDGTSTQADLFAFLESWFAADGDINEDGMNSLTDVFFFLEAWFAGN